MGLDVRSWGPEVGLSPPDADGLERHVRLVGGRGAGNQRDQRLAARHQAGGARRNNVRRGAPLLDGVRRSRRRPRVRRRRTIEIPTTGAPGVAVVTFVSLRAYAAPHQNRTTD